jgi:hypothetical protein
LFYFRFCWIPDQMLVMILFNSTKSCLRNDVCCFYPWYQGEMNDVFWLSNSSDLPLYLHPIEIPKLEDLLSLLIRSLVIKPLFLMIWSWWISFLMGWLEKIMRKSWANDYVLIKIYDLDPIIFLHSNYLNRYVLIKMIIC